MTTRTTTSLTLTCTSHPLQVFSMGEGTLALGRHKQNDIRLNDDIASRFHCVIESSSKGYVLRDLGSRNGTRLNGGHAQRELLSHGDEIRAGSFVFRVDLDTSVAGAPGEGASGEAGSVVAPAGDIPLAGSPAKSEGAGGGGRAARGGRSLRVRREGGSSGGGGRAWADTIRETIEQLTSGGGASMRGEIVLINADNTRSEALAGKSAGPAVARLLLMLAARARSTDIHIEPKREATVVRVRIDGSMVHIVELPAAVGESALSLFRTACQFPQTKRDAVLDGHFSAEVAGARVDYRASFTPTVHGTKLVLRVLDPRSSPQSLNELRMPADVQRAIERLCESDAGMLLAAGPTGSGKTTTLYNAVRSIDRDARNVVTIEDPVEYDISGTTQIPVSADQRFGQLLRSVLRQDPDVILVGEIRDAETARTAMEAATTGHVVFSTVHARDSISAVFRVLDLGVENYLVANAIQLIVAQRLVKVLCDACKRPVRITPGQASRIGRYLRGKDETYVGVGCASCLRTGFAGRRGLYEVLSFNDDLRDCVLTNPSIQAMKRIVGQTTFRTLQQAGWELAAAGVTSLDEVERVATGE